MSDQNDIQSSPPETGSDVNATVDNSNNPETPETQNPNDTGEQPTAGGGDEPTDEQPADEK